MNITQTKLAGVLIIEPAVFEDERGSFFEHYHQEKYAAAGITNTFVQDNQSVSNYGVIRGLHAQQGQDSQAKLVRVIKGKVLDVAVDIRKGSPTFGQHISVELSDENNRQLLIPRGFLHGFSVLSESAIFAYKCDNFYNKEAEFGVRYDDADINIDWKVPAEKIYVSPKDLVLGSLKDVVDYG